MTKSKNFPSFRDRLKAETAYLHDQLERTYPFSELANSHEPSVSTAALKGFAMVFSEFLKKNADSDEFYRESLEQLNLVGSSMPSPSLVYNEIAMKYLFLGSRMGNELIVRKNPEIVKISGGQYFALQFPRHLWSEFLQDLQKIEDSDTQNLVINSVKTYLDEMVKYGNSLERQ